MIQTTLSRNGYKIKKSELTTQLLKEIKTELTVNPIKLSKPYRTGL